MLNSTSKIKCLLVDDENKVLQAMQYILTEHLPEVEIVGTANSVEQAYQKIIETNPDVVFLDIVMPQETGFELIKRFSTIHFEIVFITSHQEYALDAIRCLALAYLLKPVAVEDIKAALQLVRERLELKQKKQLYDALLYNMEKSNVREHKLAVYNHNQTELIDIKDIIHIEGWDRYSRIHTKSKGTLTSSYNIGRYTASLQHHGFFLCHKSHMINMDYVSNLTNNNQIQLRDQTLVPLAVRKRAEFMELFSKVR
ncbi:MAG: response regulator transcription factor [Bacteroidetes bacterium]|nr:response regulator transcription factor [Bacteroidota bacterium]